MNSIKKNFDITNWLWNLKIHLFVVPGVLPIFLKPFIFLTQSSKSCTHKLKTPYLTQLLALTYINRHNKFLCNRLTISKPAFAMRNNKGNRFANLAKSRYVCTTYYLPSPMTSLLHTAPWNNVLRDVDNRPFWACPQLLRISVTSVKEFLNFFGKNSSHWKKNFVNRHSAGLTKIGQNF